MTQQTQTLEVGTKVAYTVPHPAAKGLVFQGTIREVFTSEHFDRLNLWYTTVDYYRVENFYADGVDAIRPKHIVRVLDEFDPYLTA